MNTYEFTFKDATKMVGEGADPADALYDAYLKNGYLPFCGLVAKENLSAATAEAESKINPHTKKRNGR